MWSSNIGWNADRPIGSSGVGNDRKEAISQRSITFLGNAAIIRQGEGIVAWSNGLRRGPLRSRQALVTTFPQAQGWRLSQFVQRALAHAEGWSVHRAKMSTARSSMRPKSRWLSNDAERRRRSPPSGAVYVSQTHNAHVRGKPSWPAPKVAAFARVRSCTGHRSAHGASCDCSDPRLVVELADTLTIDPINSGYQRGPGPPCTTTDRNRCACPL